MEADIRASKQRSEVATNLVERLLHAPEQPKLFELDPFVQVEEKNLERIRKNNPGKLVIMDSVVDEYSYEAAMHGAGFHPSQFDEITWRPSGESGVGHYVDPLGAVHLRHLPERIGRPNKMRDEVGEELFTNHVPTTKYESPAYVTSVDDLQAIFEFDQMNMEACKLIYEDVLYERENI